MWARRHPFPTRAARVLRWAVIGSFTTMKPEARQGVVPNLESSVKKHLALLGALALPGTVWADCVAPSSIGGIRYVIEADSATPAELASNPWQFDADGYLIWQEGMPEWARGARRIDDFGQLGGAVPPGARVPTTPPRKMSMEGHAGGATLLGCGDEPWDGEAVQVRARRMGVLVYLPAGGTLNYIYSYRGSAGHPIEVVIPIGSRVHQSQHRIGCAHPEQDRIDAAQLILNGTNYHDGDFLVFFTSRTYQIFRIISNNDRTRSVVTYSDCLTVGG